MCSLSAALNLFVVSILAIDWLVELCSVRTFSEEHNSVQTVNDWLIQWIGNISLSPCETSFVILPPHYHFDRGIDDRCSSVHSGMNWAEREEPVWALWGLFTWNVENWVWHLRDLVLPDWSPTSGVLQCSVWGVIGGVLTTMPRFVHT